MVYINSTVNLNIVYIFHIRREVSFLSYIINRIINGRVITFI